jgi:outer membrane autotransporter protein
MMISQPALCRQIKGLARQFGLAALMILGTSTFGFGGTSNWSGATSTQWGTSSNWNAAPANGYDLVFGATTATNTTSNNNSSLTSVDSFTFQGSQAFTLTGSAITLGPGKSSKNGIINNSSQTQTIDFGGTGVTLSSSDPLQSWTAQDGGLTISSKVVLNGTSLGLHGPKTITLSSAISGGGNSGQAASIVVGDSGGQGVVVISGNNTGLTAPGGGNTYSVALLAGTLTIGNVNALGTGALLIDHSNNNGGQDTFATSKALTIANAVTARNSFTFDPTGSLVINGAFTLDTATGTTTFNLSNNNPQGANSVNLGGVVQQLNGTAAITFNGGGTFVMSGASANTYTGLTTVKNNTQLDLRKSGGVLAVQGDLNVFSGSKLQLQGDGEINSTSNITMNGEWDFNGHSQTVATVTDDGTGSGSIRFYGGQLTIGGSSASSYSGGIQDNGAETGVLELVKTGSGTLTLTDNGLYTGDSKLEVGAIEIGSSNALGTGSMSVTGGTLETNGVEHTINIGNTYSQSGGTLVLTLLSSTDNSNEKLAVAGGTASSLGGNLDVNGNNITLAPNLTYDLATFTGGYNGRFNAYVSNLNTTGYIEMFDYLPNNVTLTFLQAIGGVSGLTANQHSVGVYIDSFAANAPDIGGNYQTLVNNLYLLTGDPSALGSALDQISPQSLQIWRHIAFDNSVFYTQLVNNHLADLRDGLTGFDASHMTYMAPGTDPMLSQIHSRLLAWSPPSTPGLLSDSIQPALGGVSMADPKDLKLVSSSEPQNPWSTFLAGSVILAGLSHDQDLAYQNYTTSSVLAGADYRIDSNWTVGALLSYGHTDADLDHLGSTTTVDSYSPGVYASYVDPAGWYGNGTFAYDYNSYTEDRNIRIGALSGTNQGAPQGNQFVGNLTGGYEFTEGKWKVGPTAEAQFVNLGVNSFAESGPTALNVQAQNVDSFRTQLGFEARYAGHAQGWFGNWNLTPHFSATWQHAYLDEAGAITSDFNQLGTGSFSVQTTHTERDSAFVDVGLDAELEKSLTLFLDYETQAGEDNYYAQSIQGGLKIGF